MNRIMKNAANLISVFLFGFLRITETWIRLKTLFLHLLNEDKKTYSTYLHGDEIRYSSPPLSTGDMFQDLSRCLKLHINAFVFYEV